MTFREIISVLLLQIIIVLSLKNVRVLASCPFHPVLVPIPPVGSSGSSTSNNVDAPTPIDFCNLGPKTCVDSKYRSLDGSCNNLANPLYGLANYKFGRLLPPKYSDGIRQPTGSLAGGPLPNARLISLTLFGEQDAPDLDFTLMNMQWGQIIVGDLSRVANGTYSKRYVSCCTTEGRFLERNPEICFNLDIPPEDLLNIRAGNECMDFVRTLTDEETDCNYNGGPVEQLNAVTSYLDMSTLYGNRNEVNRRLRAFRGGRMIVDERNGHTWLPKNPNTTEVCDVENESDICYATGDIRVNSIPGITILATMNLREHNRLAGELAKLNPHWSDEVLYQEARKILTAQFQHIAYYEYLPLLLGRENMLRNKLIYDVPADCHVNDYDPSVDATVVNEFATGAFRHFHSQCEGRLDLVSELRSVFGSLRLSDWYHRPEVIEIGDNFDSLSRGLGSQPQQLTDINIDEEVKHFLFRKKLPLGLLGSDLRAIDTHRGRDHGLASYNDVREFCGLKRAKYWEDFADHINIHSVEGLRTLYRGPEDVDFNVGGSLETPVPGTLAGPTFLCILTEQFYRTRIGDRYFYENDNPKTGFTRDQLQEIRKSSASRIVCDNGNQIQTMQPRAFITVSEANPIVPCADLPSLDLSKWIDRAPPPPQT
ncbi:peroxidase-like [Eupeodes corollae]|uniref:peroxidase-like n=1 Tax=Eupeodes corollae TaxID=290404 RepID=UPI002490694D|nr:peroxidase-like [Eupeodes corollae]